METYAARNVILTVGQYFIIFAPKNGGNKKNQVEALNFKIEKPQKLTWKRQLEIRLSTWKQYSYYGNELIVSGINFCFQIGNIYGNIYFDLKSFQNHREVSNLIAMFPSS